MEGGSSQWNSKWGKESKEEVKSEKRILGGNNHGQSLKSFLIFSLYWRFSSWCAYIIPCQYTLLKYLEFGLLALRITDFKFNLFIRTGVEDTTSLNRVVVVFYKKQTNLEACILELLFILFTPKLIIPALTPDIKLFKVIKSYWFLYSNSR